ncbi:probable phospholipid-transporting ATPase IIB isoform X2 [Cydia pomonella]|uniref:probable phospholipid-transporting ATPase IIB isoform X2 n=1 Tax=Cydia pomonella TaxID=82600 RepID=UPI002ADDAA31|nr:probable phospholipid-transporting ATPase IIB isoform X2 [Cydia pomonella]
METTPLLSRPKRKSLWSRFSFRKKELTSRVIYLGQLPDEDFPPNFICNQKYNILTFLPLVLYDQFRFFLNLYFLVMALSQFIPSIRIGYLYTYWGPLCFVLAVTLFREAVDDFRRYRRDKEVNRQCYERVVLDQNIINDYRPFVTERVPASALRVGDIVMLHKGQRVPADMILLRTNETMGTVFIRTDQLDGEIDWKLRIPLPSTQKLPTDAHLLDINAQIFVEKPEKDIHSFIGTCTRLDEEENDSLDIENTLWSGCVVASGQATGLIIYTGSQTRSVMNNSTPRSKVGRLELQVNDLTKLLFAATLLTSFLMIVLKGFNGPWYGFLFRFELLFSYIIPISLRVNLDMGKVFYSWTIQKDKKIEGTVMRSTTIPEELGRIQYLLADKTGTLTKNEMVFQKLHLGNALYDNNLFYEVEGLLTQYLTNESHSAPASPILGSSEPLSPTPQQVWRAVLALALCHNVTPVYELDDQRADEAQSDMGSSMMSESCGGAVPQQELCDYQASSPDEVALVKWTDRMGVSLYRRDFSSISLKLRATNEIMQFSILQIFHFTSESKMMGIIVQEEVSGEITYYVKGADVALAPLLESPWLNEECKRLAAEGLRTLVVAKKILTKNEYLEFESEYKEARLSVTNRAEKTMAAMSKLQCGLQLLGLTGVEDRLADHVPETMAMLRAAGIKIWMLTGDKLETALCIARSLHLGGGSRWFVAPECSSRRDAHALLRGLAAAADQDLIIEGETLEMCLQCYEDELVEVLCGCSGVVVARCSPTQKARVAQLLRARGRVVAAVGDGGNDVAMIQEADIGVGIEGAEGRAASLAGDVSVRAFSSLARLLLVHGRRAVMRSAALSLFIVHRGLIVSTMQAVFSVVFYFSSVSLYPGFLMVGYGTLFTMLPVFSLVLDKDIPSSTALKYPQLYKQLTKGRQLSYKTFYIWTGISIYQGGVIMYGALVLFEDQLIHIVEISYTALILTELIMVALTVDTWHRLMVVAELASLLMYATTLLVFNSYFDSDFIKHWDFWWKVTTITLVSCLPLYIVKFMHRKWSARQYRNIRK